MLISRQITSPNSSEMRTTDEMEEVCLTLQKEGGCVEAAGPQPEEATMKHEVGSSKIEAESAKESDREEVLGKELV